MKVRLRGNGYKDWKVLEESSAYYIVEGDFAPLALKKLEYEPVQEWVDETWRHDGPSAMGLLARSNYRLVRCEVSELHNKYKAYAYLLERVKQ